MDWICGMQKALDYIETHLTESLNYEQIAKEALSSSFHFQRVFSLLCGYTLGEYIRNRRLTLAGAELASSQSIRLRKFRQLCKSISKISWHYTIGSARVECKALFLCTTCNQIIFGGWNNAELSNRRKRSDAAHRIQAALPWCPLWAGTVGSGKRFLYDHTGKTVAFDWRYLGRSSSLLQCDH